MCEITASRYSANFSVALDLDFEADLLGAAGLRVRVPTSEWVLESQQNGSLAASTSTYNIAF